MNKKFFIFIILFLILFFGSTNFINAEEEQEKDLSSLEHPIIFIHGLTSDDLSFADSMEYLDNKYGLGPIYAFDVILNADNNSSYSVLENDVEWNDWHYKDKFINVGRRNFSRNIDDFRDGWEDDNSKLFAVNFSEDRIRGASGNFLSYFKDSNQAAIMKQGYALRQVIKEVLEFTKKEKVILVGHSMGGLAIREYLQRTDDNGNKRWWLHPDQEDGHKVLKVITLGTPHLGSNAGPDTTTEITLNKRKRTKIPKPHKEGMRDLRYLFNSYPNCPDEDTRGIYLFGGNEKCISSTQFHYTFGNVDINCNGREDDEIIGINYKTSFNPKMPLPINVHYIYVISDVQMGECSSCLVTGIKNGVSGDGAVLLDRQWLYNDDKKAEPTGFANVIQSNMIHSNESGDYESIIKALKLELGTDDDWSDNVVYEKDNFLGIVLKILNKIKNFFLTALFAVKNFIDSNLLN